MARASRVWRDARRSPEVPGKMFPAFPLHAQPTIWQETHRTIIKRWLPNPHDFFPENTFVIIISHHPISPTLLKWYQISMILTMLKHMICTHYLYMINTLWRCFLKWVNLKLYFKVSRGGERERGVGGSLFIDTYLHHSPYMAVFPRTPAQYGVKTVWADPERDKKKRFREYPRLPHLWPQTYCSITLTSPILPV